MRPPILSRYLCVLLVLLGPIAAISSAHEAPRGIRPLTADEGMGLVNTVWAKSDKIGRKPDCSHLVHEIYELSGFPYPYASSYDLYEGIDSFRPISTPRPGDLVVWRGHVGIIIDATERTFYSSVRSGLRTEYYDGPYWREQGRPRFYRYVLRGPAALTATNDSLLLNNSTDETKDLMAPVNVHVADDAPPIGQMRPQKWYRRHLHPYQRRP
jgi:hypothetical protein